MKTFDDFIAWLEKQPKDRRFRNYTGRDCVGHHFLAEKCGETKSIHSLEDIDAVVPGFNAFYRTKIAMQISDTVGSLLPLAKQFKSEQNLL